MGSILMKGEIQQPKPHIAFQALGIDLVAVSLQKTLK
jgi:hypothetical protein